MAAQAFFQSNADATKKLDLDIDTITTATTRVWTMPDANVDARGLKGAQAITPADNVTHDVSLGAYATLTLDRANTNLSFSNGQVGLTARVKLTQDATGGRTLALGNGTLTNGALDTTANAVSYIDVTFNGTDYDVQYAGDDLSTYYTKTEVDNLFRGLAYKDSARVATTAAGTLATDFENLDTVDGVTLATNDRILIKNQASAIENGVYIVQASGAPVRATDFDSAAELEDGAALFVLEGTTNADTGWVMSSEAPDPGTDAINFVQFSGTAAPVDSVFGRAGEVVANPGDYDANQVDFTPTGDIVATDVQAAIAEVDAEKLADDLTSANIFVGNGSNVATGVAMSGDVTINNAGVTTVVTADFVTQGKVELATSAEVTGGVDNARAVTAAGVDSYFTALVGNASGVQHVGTFTGSIIGDNQDVKTGMQDLETALHDRTLTNGAEQTGAFTAAISTKYSVDTTGGAVTATLPAGGASLDGLMIQFQDTKGDWGTNSLTVAPDGTDNINGANSNQVVSDDYGIVNLEWDNDNATWIFTKTLPSYTGSPASATTTTEGVVELATDAEVFSNTATGQQGPLVITSEGMDHYSVTLIGNATTVSHMGTFTGTIIADNGTVKAALQALETDLDDIITLSGVAAESTHLATFTGTTISDNQTIKAALQDLETALETKLTAPGSPEDYTVTNKTLDRTLDCNSATLQELADVVGSLIDDLITAGLLT